MKKIYGSYLTSVDTSKAVEELLEKGYTRDDIKVVSTSGIDTDLDDENENKDFDKEERNLLENYKTKLEAGESIILIEDKDSFTKKTPDWDEREREFYEDLDD